MAPGTEGCPGLLGVALEWNGTHVSYEWPVGLQVLSSALFRTNPHTYISMVQTLDHARSPD